MSYILRETLTDANGTLLTARSAAVGGAWSAHPATPDIAFTVNNGLVYCSAGADGLLMNAATPGVSVSAYTIRTSICLVGGSLPTFFGITFCVQSPAITWYNAILLSDTWQIFQVVAGSATQIGSTSSGSLTAGVHYPVEIRVTATTITVLVDNIVVAAATDNTISRNGMTAYYYDGGPVTSTTGVHFGPLTVANLGTAATLAANDPGAFFGPYGWETSGANKQSSNPGNYARLRVTGATEIVADVDTTDIDGAGCTFRPMSRGRASGAADGRFVDTEGATRLPILTNLDPSLTYQVWVPYGGITSPAGAVWGTNGRWSGVGPRLKITGFRADEGAVFSTPALRSKRVFFVWDSMGEGAANAYDASNTLRPDEADPVNGTTVDTTLTAAAIIAADPRVNAEYGIAAFSGQGYTVGGLGSVPALSSTWDSYQSGASRLSGGLFSPAPDFIFSLHGTNDALQGATDADVTAAVEARIADWRAAAPNAKIIICIPPGQGKRSAITTGVNNYKAAHPGDKLVYLADAGQNFITGSGSPDAVHPNSGASPPYAAAILTAMQRVGAISAQGVASAGLVGVGASRALRLRLGNALLPRRGGGANRPALRGR